MRVVRMVLDQAFLDLKEAWRRWQESPISNMV